MRRLVIEEPVSRAAIWGRRVALFSVPVFAGGIVMTRRGGDDVTSGLAVIWAAALLAVVALALGLAALAQIWREGRRGLEGAIQTLLISAAVLVLPGFLALRMLTTPYYADLTTDTANPPAFSRSSATLAARAGLVPASIPADARAESPGQEPAPAKAIAEQLAGLAQRLAHALPLPAFHPARLRDMQRRAHPDFRPLRTDLPPEEAFSRALKAAQAEGWTVIDRIPPGGLFGIGHLDAVRYSSLLRLPVDVTVRLRIHAEGTTIDVRSVPRYRLFDIGMGPRRIERFLESIAPLEG